MKLTKLIVSIILLPVLASAQVFQMNTEVENYLQKNIQGLELNQDDILDYSIYRQYESKKTKLTHVFLQQNYQGIPIHKAEIRLHWHEQLGWKQTQNSFVKDLSNRSIVNQTTITEVEAIEFACKALGVEYSKVKRLSKKNESTALFQASFSKSEIPVMEAYFELNNVLRKVWDLTIYENDASDCWNVLVDANTGELLRKYNWVQHCTFNSEVACTHASHETVESISEFTQAQTSGPAYNVFAVPLESPSHGDRTLEVAPNDLTASPYGWHDTNAQEGPEYYYTRGNNAHAYADLDDSGQSQGDEPGGGLGLIFDYSFDPMQEPDQNLDAATVNLFYMTNMMHDVWYHYGFDPAAGNFQQNNYGESGYGGDYVIAQAQDSSGVYDNIALNNANFYTPNDGTNPVMQMYIWDKPENPFDLFTVNSPEALAGVYSVLPTSGWAGEITSDPITGMIVPVDDGDLWGIEGCGELVNNLTGKIALISRGTCEFGLKALNAQNAGAIAVIIYNNVGGMVNMAEGADGNEVTIPTVFMSKTDGELLYNYLSEDGVIEATFVNNSPPGPEFLDADFDNGIIAHEYGHGISTRLTGGNCLWGDEQAGEGWSDFFALAMTVKEGDYAEQSRGIGTYVSAENNDGRGIRSYPYSRDMNLNPMTYDHIITESVPHGVGSVWATMLWDLFWNFVDVYDGYDNDRYNGTGGNNMAMQLVIDGLKLQPCNANFTEMRDAIILADEYLYGGVNECMIWETFARRGLGYSADAGLADSRGDGTQAFDSKPSCIQTLKIEKSAKPDGKSTDEIEYVLNIYNHTSDSLFGVYVIDTLQSDVTFVPTSSSCTAELNGNIVTFTIGDMASGTEIECTYEVSPDENSFSEVLFEDDMEDGDYYWVAWADEADPEWGLIDFDANSGEYAWYAPNVDYRTVSYLGLEPFLVEGDAPTLSFWHKYSTEPSYDGGYVSIAVDEVNYEEVGSKIIRGPYRGVSQASPPLGGIDSYWGNSNGFINTLIDLTDYLGETVSVRFTYVTDDGNTVENLDGWTIDDVRIIDRYEVKNRACVYSADGSQYACDEVQEGGTVMYDHYGVSVDEVQMSVLAHLFPNPSDEVVSIRLSGDWDNEVNVKVFDVQGKLVFDEIKNNQRIDLSTSDFADGMYFVEISDKTHQLMKKLTIQH